MRLSVLPGLVGLAGLHGLVTSPVAACPHGAACFSHAPAYAAGAESRAHARPRLARTVSLHELRLPETARVGTVSPLQESLTSFTPEEPEDTPEPEIWKSLSSALSSGLPRVDQEERAVSMVFHPMMVKTPEQSTVPGFGVAGTFR